MAKENAVPAAVRDDGPARRGYGDHLTRRDAEAPTSGPVDGSVSLQPDVRRLVGLQRTAGNRAVSGLLTAGAGRGERRRCLSAEMRDGSSGVSTLQRLGTPLDKPIPAGEPTPAFGEVAGEQRKFTPAQYIAMWEKEQGRKLNSNEKSTIERGCIGITANNLNGGGDPPLDLVFGTFEQAHKVMTTKNATIEWLAKIDPMMYGTSRYVVFAKLFWSNQNVDPTKRKHANKKAFLPDPKTGRVDMSGYKYREQPGYVNFDYGFWDEASQSFWHANHMDYGDPGDPMIVLQSTREKFAHKLTVAGQTRYGYRDFDRVVYGVALANNYDAGLAAISAAKP